MSSFTSSIFLLVIFFSYPAALVAQDSDTVPSDATIKSLETAPSPPSNVSAKDHVYDIGEKVDVSWELSPDDTAGLRNVVGYIISRRLDASSVFDSVGAVFSRIASLTDIGLTKGESYQYAVAAYTSSGAVSEASVSNSVTTEQEWFDWNKGWQLLLLITIAGSVAYFIYHAKKGKPMFLRKIAGLQAVEEAIGRATEMGRPILFIPGIHDMDDVQTIAGMTILAKVAKQVAEYESRIFVPTRASLAMTAARETVREAYMTAGRIDAYRSDDIYYVTDEQFGYVAAVNGIMTRDKPATCFYLGAFFAESLILAETGNSIGAIQIAGTAMPAQLPFFVAACDYTLIGEELFAASAYLSEDPKQMGSLKGQDVGKVVAMAAILIGSILATLGSEEGMNIETFNGAFHALWGVFGGGE
ncbi:fibronectin type III domain-containing protein [bacterium AH-315-J21]|nr:fibronectin type III domain-containing protein [bacterium AH-315-J21]